MWGKKNDQLGEQVLKSTSDDEEYKFDTSLLKAAEGLFFFNSDLMIVFKRMSPIIDRF